MTSLIRRGRGRPRKFAGPSRAVTLTLPESVLSALASVHKDISKAVVQLTERRRPEGRHPLAELAVFGRSAVITVRPTPSLERRADVQLVPLPDGRALISFAQAKTIAELELTLNDALEEASLPDDDRELFEAIVRILKDARRSGDVLVHRRNIIVLESSPSGFGDEHARATVASAPTESTSSRKSDVRQDCRGSCQRPRVLSGASSAARSPSAYWMPASRCCSMRGFENTSAPCPRPV